MSTMHHIQNTLAAGVMDAAAQMRSDSPLYAHAMKEARNCLPLATGGQLSRWGSRYIGPLAAAVPVDGGPLLAPFVFSLEQSYIVVFTEGGANFYFASDGTSAGFLGDFQPWTKEMLPKLRVDQGGDVMWVAHQDFPTVVIRRTAASSWIAGPMVFQSVAGTPLYRYAEASIVATWNNGTAHLTFSAPVLTINHAGCVIRMWDETPKVWRYGTIVTVITPTECTVNWVGGPPNDGANSALWAEQAFSPVHGYARSVALHTQRLVFGGSRDAGDAVWMSKPSEYFNFDLGTASAGDAIAITIGSTKVRTILHTTSGPQLTFFTEAGAYFIAEDESRPLSPTAVRPRLSGPYGTTDVRPGAFDGGMLMVQSGGVAVRDLVYSGDAVNLLSPPVSLGYTENLGVIIDATYMPGSQQRPEQYAFFATKDGRIQVFHSVREEKIGAWVEWSLDGARVLAVGAVAGVLFAAVRFNHNSANALIRFDPSLAFDLSTLHNLPARASHLIGQEVHVHASGDYLGAGTVAPSGFVVPSALVGEVVPYPPGTPVETGMSFVWRIEPLPPVVPLKDGTSVARPKRIVATHLKLHRARSAKMGPSILSLLPGGFVPGVVQPPSYRWQKFTHLGLAQHEDSRQLTIAIERDVPMPTGVVGLKREVSV